MIARYTEIPPQSGNKAKQLVVLVHGYGSNADDLITLAPELSGYLPDAHFISPEAPFALDQSLGFEGRQWFSLLERTEESMLEGLKVAAPILRQFIEQQLQRLELSSFDCVALLGFSQGAMLSLHIGLRQPEEQAVRAVLCYSGMVVAPQLLAQELQSYPSCLLVHGEDDMVVPVIAMAMTAQVLTSLEVPVTTQLRPGLEHGIDYEGIEAGGEFLQAIFNDSIIQGNI